VKLSCPACGSLSSLDALLGNEGAREAVMAALAMPAPLGKLMVQYLALFRPAQRQLSFDRVANLLNELQPMIAAAKIARNGRICSAPQDYWKQAIEEMLNKRDKLTLPLKNHGYLLTIIDNYSNKAEARKEQQHEDQLAGRTPVGGTTHTVRTEPPEVSKGEVPRKPRTQMPQTVKAILKGGNDEKP